MKSTHHDAARRAARFTVESLESRRLLSTVVATDPDGDGQTDVKITGTSGADHILVLEIPTFLTIIIDDKNDNFDVDPGELYIFDELETLEFDLKGGNDEMAVLLVTSYDESTHALYGDLGSGNDFFIYTSVNEIFGPIVQQATESASVQGLIIDTSSDVEHSDVLLEIDGNSGHDEIIFDLSFISIYCSRFIIDAEGGSNNDEMVLTLPDFNLGEDGIVACFPDVISTEVTTEEYIFDVEPSTFAAALDMGSGNNTAYLNIATDIADDSTADIDITGELGVDKVTADIVFGTFSNFYGTSRSGLTVDAELNSGKDEFLARMDFGTLGSFMGVDTYARFFVDTASGDDKIRFEDVTSGGGDSGVIDGLLEIIGKGGSGNDKIEIDMDTLGGARFTVGAEGLLRFHAIGESGADFLRIDVVSGSSSTGKYDFALLGGKDNDKLAMAFKNDGLNLSSNYISGAALLDGSSGTDRWDTEGGSPLQSGIFNVRGAEIEDDTLEEPQ